jgi:hypothetical protein
MSQYLKTRQKGTRGTAQVPNLTAHDRCDRCSARAGAVVIMPSTLELLFCLHHMNKYQDTLVGQLAVIYREG